MEVWNVFNEKRQDTGRLHRRGEELKPGDYHQVIEVITVNSDGRILLTQRDPAKSYPLLWEGTGGSVTAGETSRMGAVRELEEETGLIAEADELQLLSERKYSHYFLDYYIWTSRNLITPARLRLQKGEVCSAKLVTLTEFDEMNDAGLIVPPVWERFNLHRENINAFIGDQAIK